MAAARAAAGRWPAPCTSPAPPSSVGWRGGWPAGPALPGVPWARGPGGCCGLGRPVGLAALALTVGPGLGRSAGLAGPAAPPALLGLGGGARWRPGGPRAPWGLRRGIGRREWLVRWCSGLGWPSRPAGTLVLVVAGPGPGPLRGLACLAGVAALLGRRLVGLWLRGGPWAPPSRLPMVVVLRVLLAGLLAFWAGVLPLPPGPAGLGLRGPSLAGPRVPWAGLCVRAWGSRARVVVAVACLVAGRPGPLRLGLAWLALGRLPGPLTGLAPVPGGLAGGRAVSIP